MSLTWFAIVSMQFFTSIFFSFFVCLNFLYELVFSYFVSFFKLMLSLRALNVQLMCLIQLLGRKSLEICIKRNSQVYV